MPEQVTHCITPKTSNQIDARLRCVKLTILRRRGHILLSDGIYGKYQNLSVIEKGMHSQLVFKKPQWPSLIKFARTRPFFGHSIYECISNFVVSVYPSFTFVSSNMWVKCKSTLRLLSDRLADYNHRGAF